ncbi:MAG: IS200/IS605 family transposase [Planctomycetes bacterium]|jgi:REP element-mobilizing transposase RayT|nr:IS200/IS605 family transposase [Planctomycetota bacterium]
MSYRDINLHLVWATKDRRRWLSAEIMDKLSRYLAGAVRNMDAEAYAIDGPEDHVHLAVSLPPTLSVADYVRELKANSSRWLKDEGVEHFGWQDGYAGFSVSRSVLPKVIAYIESQREHHTVMSYEDEIKALLEKHGIEYQPQYI